MGKRVQVTDVIASRIRKTAGNDVNLDSLVVYEALALNTLPIRQKGSIFDGAVVSERTMTEMAAMLQRGEGVPIQVMHDTKVLPVGKAFWAEITRDRSNRPQLPVQFYIPNTETDLINKIENATVDEVSVGFQAKTITCSKCGFDYLGPDADFMNVLSLTCENGHAIGKDSVHTHVDGLSAWHEMSLVGKGAANGAKILSQAAAQGASLTASGTTGKALLLQLTASKEPTMPDPVTVNLSELTGFASQLATAQADLATAKKDLDAKGGEVASLTAKIDGLNTQITELAAKLAEAEKVEPVKIDTDPTLSFLTDQFTKLHVALGQKDATAPKTATELIAGITAAQGKLSSLIPVGGVANGAVSDAAKGAGFTNAAFKSRN